MLNCDYIFYINTQYLVFRRPNGFWNMLRAPLMGKLNLPSESLVLLNYRSFPRVPYKTSQIVQDFPAWFFLK